MQAHTHKVYIPQQVSSCSAVLSLTRSFSHQPEPWILNPRAPHYVRTAADEQLLAQDPGAADGDEDEHHVKQADEVLGRQRTVCDVLHATQYN